MNQFRIEQDTVHISLTQGKCAQVSLADWERIQPVHWTLLKGHGLNQWYVTNRRAGYLHQFLLGVDRADHRDGNGLNNVRSNIRACTQQQNSWNRRPSVLNTSGLKGVCRNGTGWIARIGVDGKKINLGTYSDKNEAGRQYDRAAKAYFGEFASLNFPN